MNPILFLLCHLVGDFWLQSDWCALNKAKKGWEGFFACLIHCLIYTSCFLLLTFSWKALLFIFATHFILDRFPIIIKKFIWLKNHIGPTMEYPPFHWCDSTGYYDDSPYNRWADRPIKGESAFAKYGNRRPFFITIWLYIISDNVLHLIFNYIALTLLG
jgi:hypothetical protein